MFDGLRLRSVHPPVLLLCGMRINSTLVVVAQVSKQQLMSNDRFPQRIQGMLRSARQGKGKNSLPWRRSSIVMCLAVQKKLAVFYHVLFRALLTTIHLCR